MDLGTVWQRFERGEYPTPHHARYTPAPAHTPPLTPAADAPRGAGET